jgi:hypothetical protein
VVRRGRVLAVVLVLVALMAVGWLDPWEVRAGRWPPPVVTAALVLAILLGGLARDRAAARRRGSPPAVATPPDRARDPS